jgi:flagellar biosynthesis/type III secretory pathway protein FliH
MMQRVWEKLTEKVWDDAMQVGTEIGYQAGLQAAVNFIDALIASGEHEEHEDLLESIIEELQGHNE